MASKINFGHVLNAGCVAFDAIGSMKEGNGVVKSIAKAGVNYVINDAVAGLLGGPVMLGLAAVQIGKVGYDMAMDVGRQKADKVKNNVTGTGHMGGYFADNKNAATMRQRSLQAIGGAQAQTRNALGNEARKRASSVIY